MNTLFVLQNQHGYFLGSKGLSKSSGKSATGHEWVDGQDLGALFRTAHKDEAVNMQFEVNAYDVNLRLSIKAYEANTKRQPVIPSEELPPPLPKHTPDVEPIDTQECETNKEAEAANRQVTDQHNDLLSAV